MLKIISLTTNYLKNPSGIIGIPQIGWAIESDKSCTVQTCYHLTIADSSGKVIYDSGEVLSSQSAHIETELGLEDITEYTVSVRVTDNYGETASSVSHFITGYQVSENWEGDFISVDYGYPAESFSTLLRKEFLVEGQVRDAFFIGSAHGLYNACLNGEKIGEDWLAPGWTSYSKRLQYQIYKITDLLKAGTNALCIELGAGWYKGKMSFNLNRNHYGDHTAFGGQILIRYTNGTEAHILTDSHWKGTRGPIVFSEIYDGEINDMRLSPVGWKEPGYDDSTWDNVQIVDQSSSVLTPQIGEGVQIEQRLEPVSLFTTPGGDWVVDFGQVLTGWCNLSMLVSAPGDVFKIQLFETLDALGNVYTANLRTAKQTVTYISKGGAFDYHPLFTFQGFRYAHILQWPGEPREDNFSAFVLHSALPLTGSFSCSEKLINQLHHNILWSMKGNFVDIPTDCPQRDERLGWTGDVQIFNQTAMYLANCYTFFSKWLLDVAADQTADGGVPHVVPDIITGKSKDDWLAKQGTYGASAWGDVAVILPWNLYLTYGDKAVLQRQYASMKRWIDFMTAHSSEDCLFAYALQFGDWVALDAEEGSYFGATPTSYTCAAFYCHTTSIFSKIAEILGNKEDHCYYAELAKRIKASFQAHFLLPNGHLAIRTQTAQIIALEFELVPDSFRKTVAEDLLELLKENDGHLVTGFIGTPYFCHALSSTGFVDEAYSLLLRKEFPGWLYQVTKGATTIWEHWDGLKPDGSMWSPDMNSFNHYAYGSVGAWLYSDAAGIRPDESNPGYRHFTLRPKISKAFSALHCCFDSIYGEIESSWKTEGDKAVYRFRIPANTTATLFLENLSDVKEADFSYNLDGTLLTAEIPSGSYHITYLF